MAKSKNLLWIIYCNQLRLMLKNHLKIINSHKSAYVLYSCVVFQSFTFLSSSKIFVLYCYRNELTWNTESSTLWFSINAPQKNPKTNTNPPKATIQPKSSKQNLSKPPIFSVVFTPSLTTLFSSRNTGLNKAVYPHLVGNIFNEPATALRTLGKTVRPQWVLLQLNNENNLQHLRRLNNWSSWVLLIAVI